MHNTSFENNRHRATDILEIIHANLNGPRSAGFMGEKCFLIFVDDFSKVAKSYTIKYKMNYMIILKNILIKWKI